MKRIRRFERKPRKTGDSLVRISLEDGGSNIFVAVDEASILKTRVTKF